MHNYLQLIYDMRRNMAKERYIWRVCLRNGMPSCCYGSEC